MGITVGVYTLQQELKDGGRIFIFETKMIMVKPPNIQSMTVGIVAADQSDNVGMPGFGVYTQAGIFIPGYLLVLGEDESGNDILTVSVDLDNRVNDGVLMGALMSRIDGLSKELLDIQDNLVDRSISIKSDTEAVRGSMVTNDAMSSFVYNDIETYFKNNSVTVKEVPVVEFLEGDWTEVVPSGDEMSFSFRRYEKDGYAIEVHPLCGNEVSVYYTTPFDDVPNIIMGFYDTGTGAHYVLGYKLQLMKMVLSVSVDTEGHYRSSMHSFFASFVLKEMVEKIDGLPSGSDVADIVDDKGGITLVETSDLLTAYFTSNTVKVYEPPLYDLVKSAINEKFEVDKTTVTLNTATLDSIKGLIVDNGGGVDETKMNEILTDYFSVKPYSTPDDFSNISLPTTYGFDGWGDTLPYAQGQVLTFSNDGFEGEFKITGAFPYYVGQQTFGMMYVLNQGEQDYYLPLHVVKGLQSVAS